MKYLLTGVEFDNKGAEAMTLIALNNIYQNDPLANVFFIYSNYRSSFEFKNKVGYLHMPFLFVENALKRYSIKSVLAEMKYTIRNVYHSDSISGAKAKKVLKDIDIVIDVSGFSITSKWDDSVARYWLSVWNLMQIYGAKVFLMPQSFGPFDFESPELIEYGKEVLSKCEKIYCREMSGYKYLKGIELNNIEYSPDSVLIENNYEPSRVIKNIDTFKEIVKIRSEHNICIIPNYRLIDQGGMEKDRLIELYVNIVKNYKDKSDIYIVAHAGEDLKICKEIKQRYRDEQKVILINHVMHSFNFESFVGKMDFIIASRYHAIIHAYKAFVPAIILGWADKYQEVAEIVNQTGYIVNLNNIETSYKIIEKMVKHYKVERKIIQDKVLELQKMSCYDFLKRKHED